MSLSSMDQRLIILDDEQFIQKYCSPGVIAQLKKASKLTREWVAQRSKVKYDIVEKISPFLSEAEYMQLRILQEKTGAIISGSFALAFLDNADFTLGDLDIFVKKESESPFILWLHSMGFKVNTNKASLEDYDGLRCQPHVTKYQLGLDVRSYHRRDAKIQLVLTPSSPVEVILQFHSTIVMNFITCNHAYSLFPRATFDERRALINRYPSGVDQQCIDKYIDRGWSMEDTANQADFAFRNALFAEGPRYIGDKKTWKLPLPNPIHDRHADLIEGNSWQILFLWDKILDGWRMKMFYDILSFPEFKNAYTLSCPSVKYIMGNIMKQPVQ
ncbi:hypothetical protein CVT24_006949 [Panaeolus cyanescens]|uniref:Nucleotidyltransferase family protein n=1 Tax=Panaeolus cyanescens TaxID=181874 RepID=A0A409YX37_9AGAR|nr:hypothetical protein CVT24_006949 [Panaeolus cyanescens]